MFTLIVKRFISRASKIMITGSHLLESAGQSIKKGQRSRVTP